MPPKKSSAPAELMKYSVEYQPVVGAKMNALRIIFPLHTIPHFIKMLQCGCAAKIQDPNPFESAAAAALIQTLEENMIVFKNTKNQPIEMRYGIFHGMLTIAFTLPSSMASIRQAAQIIKKSINKKLPVRAFKMLAAQNKEFKGKRQLIIDSVASTLNSSAQITIFGKLPAKAENKDKIKTLVDKVKASLPKKLEMEGTPQKPSTSMPQHQELYHHMLNSEGYTPQVLAFINASLQAAGFDFFCDLSGKRVYIAKEYCQPAHTAPLKLFIQSRLRFLLAKEKGTKESITKKLDKVSEFIHMQSAHVNNLNENIYQMSESASITGIRNLLDNFSTIFKP